MFSIIKEKIDYDNPTKIPKRKPFYESHNGGMITVDKKKIIFFGIIDIFTEYG
jgi:1-phosphatidylinositol-4-phosphate 5-kinase